MSNIERLIEVIEKNTEVVEAHNALLREVLQPNVTEARPRSFRPELSVLDGELTSEYGSNAHAGREDSTISARQVAEMQGWFVLPDDFPDDLESYGPAKPDGA